MNDTRCYFFQIPNMVDDDKQLTPHDFRLYCHFKRVAGEAGICYQSNQTMTRATGMSKPKVINARRKLEELGYITIEQREGNTNLIRIQDIWSENKGKYLSKEVERSSKDHYLGDGKDFDQVGVKISTTKNNPF
ncbi:helix-turn-helix domain-containing protein [Chloroflexota bacterium]